MSKQDKVQDGVQEVQDKVQDKVQDAENYGLQFYEKLSKQILHDLKKQNKATSFFRNYSKDEIRTFLENPSKNADKLRDISIFLYNSSLHYRRLVQYFARMATFDYIVMPYGLDEKEVKKDTFVNKYKKVIEQLEIMNIKHEFQKIMTTVFREDAFFGYLYETKDSFYIQKLDAKYCRISSIEDGVFNYEFNMTYFDMTPGLIDTYPDEFRELYKKYKDSRSEFWQPLSAENTICIKFNEDVLYSIPPFAGIFGSLADVEYYKGLLKAKEELGAYRLVSMKIPMKKDSEKLNDFSVDGETALKYYRMASNSLHENIGVVLSPFELDQIDFKRDTVDNDLMEKTIRDFYAESGVSQILFSSHNSSGMALQSSIKNDEQIVFNILRQLERWVNRRLKKTNSNSYKFKVKILDATYYNKEELFEKYLKASQFGLPVKMMVASVLGISPSDTMSLQFLENDILDVVDSWIPLKSSHTGGADTEQEGKPMKEDEPLTDEGEETREQDKNDS